MWRKVRKCGDQRASRRFVFNELSHFLFADSWRSCGIASSVYLLRSLSLLLFLVRVRVTRGEKLCGAEKHAPEPE
jgi:hypothetical protein